MKRNSGICQLLTNEDRERFILTYFSNLVNELTYHQKCLIGSIQASGITIGDGRDQSLEELHRLFNICPSIPFDILIWRAGEMRPKFRPYVSASFAKEEAELYGNAHSIVVKKGSKIFPLGSLHKDYGNTEVIIATNSIKRTLKGFVIE